MGRSDSGVWAWMEKMGWVVVRGPSFFNAVANALASWVGAIDTGEVGRADGGGRTMKDDPEGSVVDTAEGEWASGSRGRAYARVSAG